MCRLSPKFCKAVKLRNYSIRSRTTSYGHREYQFTNVNGVHLTVHIPGCCPKCSQNTDGIPWDQYSVMLRLFS